MTRCRMALLFPIFCLASTLVSDQHSSYDYGFDVEKRVRRLLGQGSVVAVQDKTGSEIQVRQEVRQLEQDHDLWTLYILGLSMLQSTSQGSPVSYYGLAGIHGMPHQPWAGVQPVPGNENTGYCTHSSPLFPTWHRAYMALYEQVLYDLIQMIATFWPDGERQRYERAARRFRIPYWDWAASPPPGQSVLPESIGGSPFVDVNGPNGVQRIANPLFSYRFNPLDQKAFGVSPWNIWTRTLRSPSNGGPDAQSNNTLVALDLDQNRASMAQRLYALFSNNNNYSLFSNNAAGGQAESVESLHDTIHALVGGLGPSQSVPQPGHMAYIAWSAFDPIFFLHHCMVDRVFALWQAINPNSWVPSTHAALDSYTIRKGQSIDSSTALAPFFSNANGTFWTSDGVRDHTRFGYTPAFLFFEELRAQGGAAVAGIGFRNNHQRPEPSHSLVKSKIFFAGPNGNRYCEWKVEVRVGRNSSSGIGVSSSISFFLGDISSLDHPLRDAHIGTLGVFAAAPLPQHEPAGGHDDGAISGSVFLTAALVKKVSEGELAGLAPACVVPYLKRNLKMVLRGGRGDVVAGTGDKEICATLSSLRVVSSVVEAPWSEDELPRWGEERVEFVVC
ncbi:hypothetical protein VTH06DRAFT_4888 [Thermothelomyces fergusii]